ncbi:MAG: CotH kinase family protein, partial [Crocinitomicaceae bacterium]|nr:CotH kinase family protein [Crocinitomicaceae bacterium]
MKHLLPVWMLFFCLLTGYYRSEAQVIINEFCAANYSDYGLGGGWNQQYEDWVEFYNPTGAPVNIGGFWLSDDQLDPQKWQVTAGTTVPANGYKIVLLSGTGDYDPSYLGQLNTSFKVTQTKGEELVFSNASGTVLESYDFDIISPNQANQSWGRTPNGSANWAIQTNPSPAAVNSGATGTSYAPKPQISLQAGYYPGAISVTITSPEPGASIYYTLNGSTPTNSSTLYTGPINISTTKVLKARIYSANAGELAGFVETNTYFLGADQHSVYTVSISGGSLSDGSWNGDELTTIEFFGPGGVFLAEAHGDSNEHGNDSNAYGQRGFDYVTRDALGYDNAIQYPVFAHSDRDDYERLIFKAAANDNYPFSSGGAHIRDSYVCELSLLGNLNLDERKTESGVVYINGSYWGVYDIREKVDDIDYTDHYYNQPEGFVDFLKTWGNTWEEYGSGDDWYDLVDFITNNDMSVQANYDYVLTQYNTMSLIDYFILNGYVVCTDWLNWNTAWWRGRNPAGDAKRWQYALWDNDATFGHYINYTGVDDDSPDADPCQIEDMGDVGGQGHVPVLNALFDNEEFTADYVQRYAALSSTIFSCERMIHVLDSMVAVINPEMQRQCQRWGGNYNTWLNNVQDIRDFILARCNDQIVDEVADCYNVTPYNVTVQIVGTGEMVLESTVHVNDATDPWIGPFYADLPIDLLALGEFTGGACGAFAGWEITSGNGTIADPTSPETTMEITSDVTLTVTFTAPSNGSITLMTDVQPAGAGAITVDGTDQSAYPDSQQFNPGTTINVDVTGNSGFTFNHWESLHATLNPDDVSTAISISPCLSDTLIAVFDVENTFTLTVEMQGIGEVQIDGSATVDNTNEPWSGTFNGGLPIDIEAMVSPPASSCVQFIEWVITSGDAVLDDEADATTAITLNSDVTLTAVFTEDPGSMTLMTDVLPAGAGEISINGSVQAVYPYSSPLNLGEPVTLSVSENEWFTFNHWETMYAEVLPNDVATTVSITPCQSDTMIAVFDEIPHFPLTVYVQPAGAGTIAMNNTPLPSYPWTGVLEANLNYYFVTTPVDSWSVFDHWEINHHVLSPNSLSTNVSFNLTQEDTLVAVYVVTPHYPVTVL